MNILSNILKIDYTKFIIINDEKIQKEIFNIIINEIFKKYELNDMFITDYGEPLASHKIPQNIINKTPYYI